MIYALQFRQDNTINIKRGQTISVLANNPFDLVESVQFGAELFAERWVRDGKIRVEFDTEAGTAKLLEWPPVVPG